jgi:hypothetical protein
LIKYLKNMQDDSKYWDNKYAENSTGWNIGFISTPLKEYFDQLNNKKIRILIPGAGNAYEAEYLHEKGFDNVFILDWSEHAVDNFIERYPSFPAENIYIEDFFEHRGEYDLIIEQTFFCSVHPSKRQEYADKVYELLKPRGRLAGLLFDDPLYNERPPYGGSKKEYEQYFKKNFKFMVFETAYNSIKPRAGRELFINLEKIIR